MKAAVLTSTGRVTDRPLRIEEVPRPEPRAGQVLLRVRACGVCRTDLHIVEGELYPLRESLVPGHQIVGEIVQGTTPELALGTRVGVSWIGGTDGTCWYCKNNHENLCDSPTFTGYAVDGGYAEFAVARSDFVFPLPPALDDIHAAPLLCAGITTFNALRNSGARPGDVVAILGVGGLGHLGVQFASKMGFQTVAIARGKSKEPLATKLGARHYIDSSAQNVAEALGALGGAKVILATVTSGKAMSAAIGGLGTDGKLIMVGGSEEPVEVPINQFIMGRHSVQGWPSGTSADSQDTLAFSALTGVRPMIEEFPLARAADAYDRMMSGAARFRVVLKAG